MAAYIRQRPACWFAPVTVLMLAWGLFLCAMLAAQAFGTAIDPALAKAPMPNAAMAGWSLVGAGIAVIAGALGSVAMLRRAKIAQPLYALSLAGLIVSFGWMFAATDLIAHKGLIGVAFPIVLAAVAGGETWLADYARRHGWIA